MALPNSLQDREMQKFEDVTPGATAVRVTGTNFSGTVSISGLNVSGKVTEVTINNTTWTALPATILSGRNAMRLQNRSGQEIKTNYDPLEPGYVGMVVTNNGECYWDVKTIIVYAKSSTSSCVVNVEELA